MPDGQVLEFTRVTKRFNDVTAVSDFSARVEPGVVTAFLGPNGAGKTTSLRILLGQVRPTSGTATIGGVPYADLRTPLRTIGSVLEETVYRPRRTAARQLTIAAKANGIPLSRVDEVLALVGLDGEGEGRIGSFSLGMRQRLSVAHALLGDAGTLVFDEPANGLDPEGIRWMRLLMRRLADEGRTVLVSSHVLSEVEQVADHVLVLSKGRLVLSSGIESLADPAAGSVVVDAADRAALTSALAAAGFEVEVLRSGLTVRGGDAKTVGSVAAAAGVALSTLVQRGPTLEDVFIELVRGGKLAPHAEAVASQLVLPEAPASAADDAAEEAPVEEASVEETPVEEESTDEAPLDDAPAAEDVLPLEAESVPGDPLAAAVLTAGAGAAIAEASSAEDAADAASDAVDAAADAEDAAADVDHAAAELGYAADAADAEDTADAADDATDDDADTGTAEASGEVAESTETEEAPAADPAGGPSFDEILFGTASADTGETATEPHDAGEDAEHSGLEVFEGLDSSEETTAASEPESSEASEASDTEASDTETTESEASETAGDEASETAGDEASETVGDEASETASEEDADPRAAAVSSMLAAAARAYYEDEPKDYPFGEAPTGDEHAPTSDEQGQDEGAHWSVATTGVIDTVPTSQDGSSAEEAAHDAGNPAEGDQASDHHEHEGHEHEGEHPEGEHHEGEHHEAERHDGEHHERHDGEHHDHHHG
ncbi:ATP-binding cassette domain-containing protein [Microbacterium sp. OVT16B]|uniref:ATP-binding cassette domain-containing protein n=1 Tax=Microbacterium sp. OVT16B TaxID=2862682 RepID=UPI001CBDBCF0|nr:ATP-binding cassette domain-containing protein [Microbacterium sp. OVT16B]